MAKLSRNAAIAVGLLLAGPGLRVVPVPIAGAAQENKTDGPCGTTALPPADVMIAADRSGNVFLSERTKHTVLKIAPDGKVTTVAGTGTRGSSGDGGPATAAALGTVSGLVADAAGNLFIAETGSPRIRKVTPSGTITTVAGNGAAKVSGDGGPAAAASLCSPIGLAVDGAGNLFIASGTGVGEDSMLAGDYRVRKVTPAGVITTFAGTGAIPWRPSMVESALVDGDRATANPISPRNIAADASGNLYLSGHRIVYKVTPAGSVTRFAGKAAEPGETPRYPGDGKPAVTAIFLSIGGLTVDSSGNLIIWENSSDGYDIRKVSPAGIITTVADSGSFGPRRDNASGTTWNTLNRALSRPPAASIAADGAGNVFILDVGANPATITGVPVQDRVLLKWIRRISPDGKISVLATIP
jgi:hypothetical protein